MQDLQWWQTKSTFRQIFSMWSNVDFYSNKRPRVYFDFLKVGSQDRRYKPQRHYDNWDKSGLNVEQCGKFNRNVGDFFF